MSLVVFVMLALADSFWESKPADTWTVAEVQSIFEASPWSRTLRVRGDPMQVHLAAATPMRDAEKRQKAFQKRIGAADASFAEYLAMLDEGSYIVLAVRIKDREMFSDGPLVSRMQKDTQMRIGKKTYPLLTHFPPSSSDFYLRLVFAKPQALQANDKSMYFYFVVPGATDPYRQVEFLFKDLSYRGKLEY